jgi:hypothetical protein
LTACRFPHHDVREEARMDEEARLRLEYDHGSELLRGLTETRFRYLVGWGALRAAGAAGGARPGGLAIGAAFGLVVALEIARLEHSD